MVRVTPEYESKIYVDIILLWPFYANRLLLVLFGMNFNDMSSKLLDPSSTELQLILIIIIYVKNMLREAMPQIDW